MAQLIIPSANSIHFVPISPGALPQYLSKQFADYRFSELIYPWQQKTSYCQKYQRSDSCKLQFNSDLGAILVEVIDTDGQVYLSINAIQKLADQRNIGFYAWEATINWHDVPEGVYFIKVSGTAISFISEPISIKELHENTLYLEYRNSRYHEDVIFETGITFSFRVEGAFGFLNPFSADQIYNDQRYNSVVLSSRTYRNFPLSIGGSYGVPDWVIDKINLIFSCNDVKIDGKSYSKASDTKFSFNEEDNYPMRGLSFEVREKSTANVSAVSNFTAYWTWYVPVPPFNVFPSNQIFGPQEAFAVYKGSGVFANNAPVVADFSAAPPDAWLVMKEPVLQPLKTQYVNDPVFIEGTIPDSVWATPALNFNGLWRMYFTRKKVTFNPTKKTTFS